MPLLRAGCAVRMLFQSSPPKPIVHSWSTWRARVARLLELDAADAATADASVGVPLSVRGRLVCGSVDCGGGAGCDEVDMGGEWCPRCPGRAGLSGTLERADDEVERERCSEGGADGGAADDAVDVLPVDPAVLVFDGRIGVATACTEVAGDVVELADPPVPPVAPLPDGVLVDTAPDAADKAVPMCPMQDPGRGTAPSVELKRVKGADVVWRRTACRMRVTSSLSRGVRGAYEGRAMVVR